MRILFRSLPAYGHVYPLMPLADAARAAGHDVVFSTAGEFPDRLRSLGFETHPAGVTIEQARLDRFGRNPPPTVVDGDTDWDVIGDLFDECAVRTAADLIPLMSAIAPDLVIYEQLDVGAAVAADVAGIPSVCQAILRALPPHVHDRLYGTRPRMLQARHGMAPSLDVARAGPVLDSYPPSLQAGEASTNPTRLAIRPVPWSEPTASVPQWVGHRSAPLVYVTFGTVRGYPSSLRVVLEGLASSGVDVLVATGSFEPEDLPPLLRRVHVESFVHQADLLRHVDLIVHHGGCGTTSGAWVHGIPQLVLPQGADQYINADVVGSAGMGIVLKTPTPELVAMSARELLDDATYRRAAEPVRDEIAAMPDPADVLARLVAGVNRFV